MIATWMLYGTIVAILAGLGALALERGARLLGRAGRWCWVGAMLVTLALPVAAWMYPQRPVLEAAAPTQPTTAVDLAGRVDVVVPVAGALMKSPFDWSVLDRPLAFGWALSSLALLGWFALGTWRLGRMRKSWRWTGDLFVSNDVGPAVVGFVRCQVVVPEWSLALSQEQRELLLAHEAEHLAAYDSRLLLVSAAMLALVPWNPGVWWQFRRLRLAIELDCDQRVLRNRPDAATYGRLLLDVGARTTRTLVPVTAFNEPMSSLEHRIRALTALRPERPALWAAGAAVASGIALFAACEAPHPLGPRTQVKAVGMPASNVPQARYEEVVTRCAALADSMRRLGAPGWVAGTDPNWIVVPNGDVPVTVGRTLKTSKGFALPTGPTWMIRQNQVPTIPAGIVGPGAPPVFCGLARAAQLGDTVSIWLRGQGAEGFSFQSKEEEGRNSSSYIADSVRRYFGSAVTRGSAYLWFIVSSDGHVVKYGSTPRSSTNDVRRSRDPASVVPGFALPKMQSITIVGENAIAPGSQPVYWAVLRDLNRPSQEDVHDTSYNAMVPWVGDAMRRYYPGLLAATGGSPVEVWFVSDSAHHVLKTTTVTPHVVGASLGPIHNLGDVFPGLTGGTVTSVTGGATQGWARDHVTVVWVTQTANRSS